MAIRINEANLGQNYVYISESKCIFYTLRLITDNIYYYYWVGVPM